MIVDPTSVTRSLDAIARFARTSATAGDDLVRATTSVTSATSGATAATTAAREAVVLIGDAPLPITPQRVLELGAGRAPSPADARALGAWQATLELRDDPTSARRLASELIATDVADWTPEQYGTAAALAHADGVLDDLALPRSLRGTRDLSRLVAGRIGDDTAVTGIRRYADAWRATLDDATTGTPRERVVELLSTGGLDGWDSGRWRALAAALDSDSAASTRHLRSLPDIDQFASIARRAADGDTPAEAHRYAAAWRVAHDPELASPAARRATALELLEASPDELDADQWRRLAALVDTDVDRALRTTASTDDLPDLATLATRHADGVVVAAESRRALAAWRAVVDGTASDPARMRSEFRRLLERVRREPVADDLLRMSGLLDADTSAEILLGPRRLAGAGEFGRVVRELAHRPDGQSTSLHRYVDAWIARMDDVDVDTDSIRTQVRALVERDPARLTTAEWKRLATLVDVDTNGTALRVPVGLSHLEPLPSLAARAGRGLPVPRQTLDRIFAAWRVGLADDSTSLSDRVRSYLADGSRPTADQWREFGAILDLGFERTGVRMPAIADDAFRREVHALASSTRRPTPHAERVLEAWRLQLELESLGGDAYRARLLDLLSPSDGSLDPARLRGVRAIFDVVGYELDGVGTTADDTHELMRAAAPVIGNVDGAVLTIDDAIVDRWRHALDPTIISERRRAAVAAMNGGQFPNGMTPAELRGLDPHWSRRTPFEQLAVESAVGTLGMTKDNSQELARRVLALEHAPTNMPAQLDEVWRETRRLADVNMQRMQGHTPRGEVVGYGTHPDYAQMGAIRSNLELIRRLTPPSHAIDVPDARPYGQGALAEALSW